MKYRVTILCDGELTVKSLTWKEVKEFLDDFLPSSYAPEYIIVVPDKDDEN